MSVGAASLRLHGMTAFTEQQPQEITAHGYLNRKCMYDPNTKKKDRSWQAFWFSLKGSVLEYYKVDHIRAKPQGEPPPRDVLPPPNKIKMKVGHLEMDGAVVEVDYTSQENMDIQKRRKHLFRVELQNKTEMMFQAPSDDRRKTWVLALKAASRRRSIGDEEGSLLGGGIKSSRCSIKQKSVHNVHSTVSKSLTTTAPLDDPDYLDFSLAESMVSRDPRLRALKKRLQAKKQLLSQLNKMYTSFLGGNVAALYDDTLLHQQCETPTITPTTKLPTKENGEKKVVHRQMSLQHPDAQTNGLGIDDTDGSGSVEGDRRASTGDFNVPIVTAISPGVDSVVEGLETELLMDYYLIPGAEWSLLKKGDSVKVLGKAGGEDGCWYRCMAHRDVDVKIPDLSLPPPAIVNALLPGTIISQLQNNGNAVGLQGSQLQEETLVEEPLDEVEMEDENENVSTPETPASEETDGDSKVLKDGEMNDQKLGDGKEAVIDKGDETKEELTREGDTNDSPSEGKDRKPEQMVIRREHNSHSTTERRLSYQKATEQDSLKEAEDILQRIEEQPVPQSSSMESRQQDSRPKRKVGKLSRSTSSPSTSARVRLQENLSLRSVPGMAHSPILQTRFSVSSSRGGLSASFPPGQEGGQDGQGTSRMAKLLESESQTGSYSCPLVGCIPASVLKYFVEKEERKRFSISPVSSNSPSLLYAQSATSLNSLVESQMDVPVPQQNGMAPVSGHPATTEGVTDCYHGSNAAAVEGNVDGEMRVASKVSITVTSTGDKDDDILLPSEEAEVAHRERIRAHSLPPQLIYSPSPSPSFENDQGDEDSTSLCRSPSHLRQSQEFKTPEPSEVSTSQSVETSPVHKLRPASPSRGQSEGRKPLDSTPSISSLFDSGSSSKRSFFKKLFGKKPMSKPRSMTDVGQRGTRSPSPNLTTPTNSANSSSMLKSVLLGKDVGDDFGRAQERARVASISGRPVRLDGVGILIGNESSSESEDEEEDTFQEDSLPQSPTQKDSLLQSPTQKDSFLPQSSTQKDSFLPQSPTHKNTMAEKTPGTMKLEAAARKMSGDIGTSSGQPPVSPVHNMPRSQSEHTSLRMKGAMSPEMMESKEAAKAKAVSMKRPTKIRIASFKKTKIKAGGKKRPASEAYQTESESGTPMSAMTPPTLTGIFRQPPRGEMRMVYLDPSGEKYGFRLQSYGRVHEQGKVLQTFVQNVVPGSVSFMAGLYPGDAIVAINGKNVKYAPINSIYEDIKKASKGKERIALQVVFVDGVTRLECMKKSDEVKGAMKEKQQKLRQLLATERLHSSPPTTPLQSPQHIVLTQDLPPWSETTPTTKPGPRPFPYDRHLNQTVSLHRGSITSLECDALVMPLSSCYRPESESENVLFQFLRSGGEELLDELSLSRQGRVGDIIVTKGHNFNIRNIYHCIFGNLEESLQNCCRTALETASKKEFTNIVFWVDGFASLSVSPHLVLEAVRQWLHEGTNGSKFEKIVFSAKANVSLIEKHMEDFFPLQPFASLPLHERTASEVSEVDTKLKEGTVEPNQGHRIENGILESDKVQGTDNKTVASDIPQTETSESVKPQNGTQTETQTVEKDPETNTTAHKKDLMGLHEQTSVVSIGGIEVDLADENTTALKEPIPEDVELELDTNTIETRTISVENIDLDLQGVDDEMSNIQSLLLEMQQEQREVARKEQEEAIEELEELEEEDPIGLLRFLQNTSQPQNIQWSTSASAHTTPIHQGLTSKTNISRSLPGLLDDDKIPLSSRSKLNRQRIESDV